MALELEYLYDALAEPIGIVVLTDSPARLAQRLYRLRTAHAPIFENLAFVISPTEPQTQLWILKKTHERPEAETAGDPYGTDD